MAAPRGSFSFRLKDYPLAIGLNRKYSLKCYYAVLKFPNFVLEVSYTTSLQDNTPHMTRVAVNMGNLL